MDVGCCKPQLRLNRTTDQSSNGGWPWGDLIRLPLTTRGRNRLTKIPSTIRIMQVGAESNRSITKPVIVSPLRLSLTSERRVVHVPSVIVDEFGKQEAPSPIRKILPRSIMSKTNPPHPRRLTSSRLLEGKLDLMMNFVLVVDSL